MVERPNDRLLRIRRSDVEGLFIGGKSEAVRGRSGRRVRHQFREERLDRTAGLGVEHGDGIAIGIGDKKVFARFAQQELIRMFLRCPASNHCAGFNVDDDHGRLCPERDIEPLSLFVEHTAVWEWIGGLGLVEQAH